MENHDFRNRAGIPNTRYADLMKSMGMEVPEQTGVLPLLGWPIATSTALNPLLSLLTNEHVLVLIAP